MSRLTHQQLVKALGFEGTLDDDPAFHPAEIAVNELFTTAKISGWIDGADAIAIVRESLPRVLQILDLLDYSDVADVKILADSIRPETAELAEVVYRLHVWLARMYVRQTIQ